MPSLGYWLHVGFCKGWYIWSGLLELATRRCHHVHHYAWWFKTSIDVTFLIKITLDVEDVYLTISTEYQKGDEVTICFGACKMFFFNVDSQLLKYITLQKDIYLSIDVHTRYFMEHCHLMIGEVSKNGFTLTISINTQN